MIVQAACVDYLDYSPSPDQKKGYVFKGDGNIYIKQKVWNPYGEASFPWGGVTGGSWDNGDIEDFSVPDRPSNGIGGYTIQPPKTVVNSSLKTAKPYKKIEWYVKFLYPDREGDGNLMTTQEGGAKKTEGSYTHDFTGSIIIYPKGTYKITAKIYNFSDDSVYKLSHNVEYTDNFVADD